MILIIYLYSDTEHSKLDEVVNASLRNPYTLILFLLFQVSYHSDSNGISTGHSDFCISGVDVDCIVV